MSDQKPNGPSRAWRLVLWTAILALVGWNLARLRFLTASGQIGVGDFVQYWSAGRIFIQGENPYSAAALFSLQRSVGWTEPMTLMMWNPPWTLLCVLPFALLPFWTARGGWFAFNVAVLLLVADWLWRFYGGPISGRWIAWLAALLFLPCAMALYLGQISLLPLFGLAGFQWAVKRTRQIVAGLFILLIAIKPHLLYLFCIFLLLWIWQKRRWKVLAGGIAILVTSLVSVSLINPSVCAYYLEALKSDSGPLIWQTPTLGTALRMAFPDLGNWLQFAPTAVGALVGLWLWKRWRQDFTWNHYLIPILLLSMITASFGWTFDMVVLLPAVIVILVWFQANPAGNWLWFLGLMVIQVVLVAQAIIVHNYFVTFWMPSALGLLYWLGARTRQSHAEPAGV